MAIQTEADLGEALKREQDSIEIEGDLCSQVLRIKATGNVAWLAAVGCIGLAAVALMYPVPEPVTQTTSKVAALATAGGAVGILGAGAASTAISIAIAAGGVGALNSLREYKVVSQSDNKLVLRRR